MRMRVEINPQERDSWGYFDNVEMKISKMSNEEVKTFITNHKLLMAINYLRFKWKRPIRINSFARTHKYNATLKDSASKSFHRCTDENGKMLEVKAIDISTSDIREFQKLVKSEMKNLMVLFGIRGFGFYNTFVHIDNGEKELSIWGSRASEIMKS